VENVVVEGGRIADLGVLRLDIAGCDAPGVSCHVITSKGYPGPDSRISAQAGVRLALSCAVNLEGAGQPVCSKRNGPVHDGRDVDIRLERINGMSYLIAMNGSAICARPPSNSECSGVKYDLERLAIVGLGPGVDFCVRTKRGSLSHVFFTEDVENESTSVALWYVTRRRRR
jgi:hypothetical protein